jgi:uncharacterized membrane-anchored protein
VGETGADYLAVNIGWGTGLTSILMATFLLITLFFQLKSKKYIPSIYWLAVVLVSIVGTQITDILTDKLEVSLYLSTSVFSLALALVFTIWYQAEKTLSMQSINTRKRELYYWLAILLTFALGTAAGDLATEALGLGFTIGSMAFSVLIALITALYYLNGINATLAFWICYILTRPLGASLGDLLSQSKEYGGLGFGTIWTSAIFLSVIVCIVSYLSFKQNQNKKLELSI